MEFLQRIAPQAILMIGKIPIIMELVVAAVPVMPLRQNIIVNM